jgi:hypothetical protein
MVDAALRHGRDVYLRLWVYYRLSFFLIELIHGNSEVLHT